MGNYNSDARGGGDRGGFRGGDNRGRDRGNRGFKPRFGGGSHRDARPVTMHSAVCSACGKTCEVPFRPSGDKPVYCKECFSGKKDPNKTFTPSAPTASQPRPNFGSNSNNASQTSGANSGSNSAGSNADLRKQMDSMNAKLERLIVAVQALTFAKNAAPEISESKIIPKPETVKKATKKVVKKTVKDSTKKKIK